MLRILNYEIRSDLNKKIAHFSDIHFAKQFNKKKFEIIIKELKRTKPDYICITGDTVDSAKVTKTKKMEYLFSFLEELTKISKVIVVLGNHDTKDEVKWYLDISDKVILLDNSSYKDKDITFYGITLNNDYYDHEANNIDNLANRLKEIKLSNKCNILLVHSPINFDKEEIKKINKFDLVLTGHMHNGMMPMFIPGNRGLIAPSKRLFPKNARNSFKSGSSKVIICGGITKLSVKAGIFHLFNPLFASDLDYIHIKNVKKS